MSEAEADALWSDIKGRWNDPAPEPDPELVRDLAREYVETDPDALRPRPVRPLNNWFKVRGGR